MADLLKRKFPFEVGDRIGTFIFIEELPTRGAKKILDMF